MKPSLWQSRMKIRTWILVGVIEMLSSLFLTALLPLDFLLYENKFSSSLSNEVWVIC